MHSLLESGGYRVEVNLRFSGGWLVRRFVDVPEVDAVQIELNQRCYLPASQVDAFPKVQVPRVEHAQFEGEAARLGDVIAALIEAWARGRR